MKTNKSIQKLPFSHPQKNGTKELIKIYRDQKPSFAAHTHDFFELMLINTDDGFQKINNRRFDFKKRQVFFLSMFNSHEMNNTVTTDYYNIAFGPELLISAFDKNFSSYPVIGRFFFDFPEPGILDDDSYQSAVMLCELLIKENKEKKTHNAIIVCSLFKALMSIISRFLGADEKDRLPVLYALQYIGENYSQKVTTAKVARDCGLSSSRLAQLFRSTVGRSFKELLIQRRLIEAKKMLQQTNLTVYQVMNECGFTDSSYFNRAFVNHAGCSPGVFRKRTLD